MEDKGLKLLKMSWKLLKKQSDSKLKLNILNESVCYDNSEKAETGKSLLKILTKYLDEKGLLNEKEKEVFILSDELIERARTIVELSFEDKQLLFEELWNRRKYNEFGGKAGKVGEDEEVGEKLIEDWNYLCVLKYDNVNIKFWACREHNDNPLNFLAAFLKTLNRVEFEYIN